ncbi:MAG: DUF5666 domain-containing protein [Syntrophobacteraceae bacterium]|jgi:hypothetical protein
MSKKKPVCLSRLTVGFSLLIMVSALFCFVALPAQNARACDGGEQQVGFMLQAPITSTTCPTINVLGLSINTTDAIFGYEGYGNYLHCDTLTAGQTVRVTFSSDTLTSGQLTATSVTEPEYGDQNQGAVILSGPIQASPAPTTTSVSILGLPITITSTTILQASDDEPLTPASLAALTPVQLAEGQFANVVSSSTTLPLTATSLYLHLLETKVVAPLDSTFTCPNISVLGQTISTSSAVFEGSTLTCADLQPGQLVKVTLQDQTGPPLVATEVERAYSCGDESAVRVTAPLNAISISALPYTVSVLGSAGAITVDISNATLLGEDGQPISLGQLMVGQFVQMMLTSNVPATSGGPFTAYVVTSMAPGTVVDFDVFDRHGQQVNDETNDISSVVTFTRPGKGAAKTVTLHTTSSGKFSVANIPQGQAKVVVTRVVKGQKSNAASTVKVARKTTQNVRIILNH